MNIDIVKLQSKLEEVFVVAPNDLGVEPLTRFYKYATGRLKVMPFLYLVPLALLIAILIYMTLGFSIVTLASLLQHGF